VHHEERGQAANRHRDRVHHNAAQALQKKHDFVRRTILRIEEDVIARTRQWSDRDILIGDDAPPRQRHYRVIGDPTAIHKCAAQDKQSSADASFDHHHVPRVIHHHHRPVFLDMPQTVPDIALVNNQGAVLGDRHDRVKDRWHHFRLFAHLLIDEHVVKYTRYHVAVEEKVANDHEENIRDSLDSARSSVGQRPDAEHAKHNATLLDHIFHVGLVMFIGNHN